MINKKYLKLILLTFISFFTIITLQSQNTNSEVFELAESKKEIFISTASSLRCRQSPDQNGGIVKEYKYGSLLFTIGRNGKNFSAEGKKDYWYYIEKDKCWVFGGFTLKTGSAEATHYPQKKIFAPEITVCGGASCLNGLGDISIVGKYFLTSIDLEDYCMTDETACHGTLIGETKVSTDKITLGKTIEIGMINQKGIWIGKVHGYRNNYSYKGSATLVAVKQKGIHLGYYADSSYDTRSKEEVEKDCPNLKDICAKYFTPQAVKSE